MIVAEGVSKIFDGEDVLKGLGLRLEAGTLHVLSGPSGAGKTTLLRLLAGLDRPTTGVIEFDGEVASGPNQFIPPHLRSVGFVFQSPTLWPHMTVLQNVGFAMRSGSARERRTKIMELLETLAVPELAKRYPGEISQGQAQRVSLARALAADPRHLFLDEPFANLDVATRDALLPLIIEQARHHQRTVLFVTHDEEEKRKLGGTQLNLRNGTFDHQNSTGDPGDRPASRAC